MKHLLVPAAFAAVAAAETSVPAVPARVRRSAAASAAVPGAVMNSGGRRS